jgi:predicted dehydrogenase
MADKTGPDRRQVLAGAAAAALTAGLAPRVSARAPGRGERPLRLALVGCGGRGSGAAAQALAADEGVELVAMADAFSDRLEASLGHLKEAAGDRVKVPEDARFVGFDAYARAMEREIDVVVLATPPGFRPQHFAHAVELGLHVFMEKPVAVDAPGVRTVLDAARRARDAGLKVGVGLQRHHDPRYQETVRRLRDGAIGDPVLYRVYWNSAGVWVRPREDDQTEMQYQMRNWYYFNWLCGDHIVEQHIHNLDVANWIAGAYPERAQGQGGRQVRTGKDHGEIYDHHMVEFTYADGAKMLSQCRHQPGTWSPVSEHVHGTFGTCDVGAGRMSGRGGWEWNYEGERADPYQREHDVFFAAIRQDLPHNEAELGAMSTMTSILGRLATYSGREVSMQEALASEVSLAPARFAFDAPPQVLPDAEGRYPIAIPGVSQVF